MTARALTSPMAAALAAPITQPGFLVTIAFASGTLHFSSRGMVTINGIDYTGVDMEVTGLGADAKGEQKGSVRIGNTDSAIGAIALNEANADWAVTVQSYDAAAVATGDPVQIFEGTGNGAGGDERWVTIDLTSGKTSTQLVPSEYITAEQGFSFLPPAGMRIVAGNEIYTLQPSRN
jgi:hypothetical protein